MTTATGMTAVGMIVETIGAGTIGAGIIGVESKPAEKLSVVIGSAIRIAPCGTVTKKSTVTIVAR
jgi:ADP-ribosylglycohydrolase